MFYFGVALAFFLFFIRLRLDILEFFQNLKSKKWNFIQKKNGFYRKPEFDVVVGHAAQHVVRCPSHSYVSFYSPHNGWCFLNDLIFNMTAFNIFNCLFYLW